MRQDIEFDAEGTTLRGWLYVPDEATGPAPTIVMCHGYSAVKEMFLDAFAEVFCDAGFCALVYDNRNLGASDGEPRQEIDPWAQVRDYRHAITFARTLDEVDGERIGIWGSSYSGAHVLVVGAIDRRVKCVVAQVPLISGHENARRLVRADLIAPTQDDVRGRPRGALSRRGADDDRRSSRPRASRARCRPPTPTSGSRRTAPSGRRRGSTSARCAASRCSGSTSRARTCRGSHRRRC